jgi:hypothetical protein
MKFEAQYDAARQTVTLVAAASFNERHVVTVPADSPEIAAERLRQFRSIYNNNSNP